MGSIFFLKYDHLLLSNAAETTPEVFRWYS